jgi:hypothetical protein
MEDRRQPRPLASETEDLYGKYVESQRRWLELFSDTAWWSDAGKRRAMLQARLTFQQDKLNYLLRQREAMGNL